MRALSLLGSRGGDAVVVAIAIIEQVWIWTGRVEGPRAAVVAVGLLWSLPLLWRRRFPLGAPLLTVGVILAGSFSVREAIQEGYSFAGAIVAAASIGAHNDRHRAVGGFGMLLAAVVVVEGNLEDFAWENYFFIAAILGAAALVAHLVRIRSLRARELAERAARLERERDAGARAAVAEERARIARELHDVVAHSISVMTIQAGAARLLLDAEPDRAEEPLLSIETTGRETLAEMRRLLGVLRADMAPETLEPRPTIANIPALVEHVRASGLPVALTVEGGELRVAPGVDLAAYRIVQEALTNVRKHAGLVPTHVALRYGPDALELEVENERGEDPEPGAGGGHGLVGMRERVELFSGSLEVGASETGGFRVRARLPVGSAA